MALEIRRLLATAAPVLAALLADPVAAQETPVDLELVLAVDVSGSMDADERRLQRDGYVAALRHPDAIDAIASGIHGRIALTYVEWAGPSSQAVIVPWRPIDGVASAAAFARELEAAPSARIRGTSISGALLFAAGLFAESGFAGERRVIDVSGDGPNNMGRPVAPARDQTVARGITINGLPVMLRGASTSAARFVQLDLYYRDCVIGGPGAFLIAVQQPAQLAEAIRRKLILEIAGPPPGRAPAVLSVAADATDCLIGEGFGAPLPNQGDQ